MANNCIFIGRIVGKTSEDVRKVVDAFKYKDYERGFFMARIFSADLDGQGEEDGLFYADITGDCAWSVKACMLDQAYFSWRGIPVGEPKHHVWRDQITGELMFANIPVTIQMLCKERGCGIELWSQEPGSAMQEHVVASHTGELVACEHENWELGWDEEADEPDPSKDSGGFEDWGSYGSASSIYGQDGEDE